MVATESTVIEGYSSTQLAFSEAPPCGTIPLSKVSRVICDFSREFGGRVIEKAETEYMVRGKGQLWRMPRRRVGIK